MLPLSVTSDGCPLADTIVRNCRGENQALGLSSAPRMSEVTALVRRQRIIKELNSLGAVSLSPVTCTNPSDVKKRN